MPTASNPTALLSLSGALPGAPWNWAKWVEITRIDFAPWNDTSTTSVVGWGADKAAKVAEYARALWGKSEGEQIQFSTAKAKKVKNRKKKLAKRAKGKANARIDADEKSGARSVSVKGKDKMQSAARSAESGRATPAITLAESDMDETDDEQPAIRDAVDQGRTIWNKWATAEFNKWKINKKLDRVLADAGKSPLTVMKKLKTTEVGVS
jgi:hypothetical protein